MRTFTVATGEVALVLTHEEVYALHLATKHSDDPTLHNVHSRLVGTISKAKRDLGERNVVAEDPCPEGNTAPPPEAIEVRWS